MILRTAGLLASCILLLAACGSEGRDKPLSTTLFDALKAQRAAKRAADQTPAAARLTRAQVDAAQTPILRLTLQVSGTVATAGLAGQNAGTQTYLMATTQAVYLKGGFLTGTRGLGHDLMSVDLSHSSVAAAARAGSQTRVHRYLNSENTLVALSARCTLSTGGPSTLTQLERSYSVRPVVEDCVAEDGTSFRNTYALDAATGQVWQSSQWIGAEAGQLLIEQLK